MDRLAERGIPRDRLPCAGCRNVDGDCPVINLGCETYGCVRSRGVEFCHECSDFPCSKLCPSAQRADVLPHNMKVFGLCTIKRLGVDGFVKVSGELERLYFRGRMEIGKGPSLA